MKRPPPANGTEQRPLRCAIYTRKSTEEGLDSDFNSLDAQREAAEAFIASQRGEGWTALPDRYDDGGYSGGNIERPAIQQLLKDIEAKRVDAVVVYKVDRLSRSLLDFTRILEVLNAHGIVFVSVTQQFNTATSAGRLMLNVLLSFAQFEREMIAERTRDKMSAARRKGRWVGGMLVLGYDVGKEGGKVVVNKEEAERTRAIFDLFLAKGSLIETAKELNARGWTTKSWVTKKGKHHAGTRFDRVNLKGMLRNVIYVGKVNHKGTVYAGAHEGIVDPEVFQRVQVPIAKNERPQLAERVPQGMLLTGLLRCGPCDAAMVPSYTTKGTRRYRYYVCERARKEGYDACPAKSVAAVEIERLVTTCVRTALPGALGAPTVCGEAEESGRVRAALRRAIYDGASVTLVLKSPGEDVPMRILVPIHRRSGERGRTQVCEGTPSAPAPQVPRVARVLALAHRFAALLRDGAVRDRAQLARTTGIPPPRVTQIMSLLHLAPDIQERILTRPRDLAGSKGLYERDLHRIAAHPDWRIQREVWAKREAAQTVLAARRYTPCS